MSFRTTVIPVAGLGTRFLPATKATPKEMLPVFDRPLLQYAVEESVAAGGSRVVLITAPGKTSVLKHFAADPGLEATLRERGKTAMLQVVQSVTSLAQVEAVEQRTPRGVGHAILQARETVGDEYFGVMFPDDFLLAKVPVLEQLRRVHAQHGGVVLAVERVPHEHVERYGVISGERVAANVYRVNDMVEKPSIDEAPTDLAIVGRYVLPLKIFRILGETSTGVGGEVQLTDALRSALGEEPCHAVEFEGLRYDCGSRFGLLQATVEVARRHPEVGGRFRRYLSELD